MLCWSGPGPVTHLHLMPSQMHSMMQRYTLSSCEDEAPSQTGAPSFTGMPLFLPEEVLQGRPHTVSNGLEGLFISLISISSGGKLSGRHLVKK